MSHRATLERQVALFAFFRARVATFSFGYLSLAGSFAHVAGDPSPLLLLTYTARSVLLVNAAFLRKTTSYDENRAMRRCRFGGVNEVRN